MLDDDKLRHLCRAVESSYRKIEPFRNLMTGLVRQYAGPAYGSNADEDEPDKHMNLLNQAVDAYMMLLSANLPQVLVSTNSTALSGFASHFRLAINNLLKEIDFGETHSQWVMNAFFCVGVVKVHLADSGQLVAADDVMMDPGTPYVSNVSLDNFVYDTSAKKASEAKFMGDMYRVPFEALKDENTYDQKAIKSQGVRPSSKVGAEGERLERISVGYEVDDDEYEPMVDLCDIYVARERTVYTFVVKDRQLLSLYPKPIAKMKWVGTKRGPYRILGFGEIPENIMPVSPAVQLAVLDKLVNNLMEKQSRQAHRQKENPVYTPAGADSARNLQNAADGEWVQVQDPRDVNVIRQGGPDPGNQQFLLDGLKLFDRMAGNLPAMLGLGTSADTVGQEKLIHASGSRKEGKMQEAVLKATVSVIEELAYLLWVDQFKTVPGVMTLEGHPDYQARADWVPGDREGEFKDYQFHIDVYSMTYRAPGDRVRTINELLGQIYIPMAGMLAEQGGMIDFGRLTTIYSELLDLPRLREVVTFAAPIGDPMETASPISGGGKPATTERRYIRQNAQEDPTSPDRGNWSGGGMGARPTLEMAANQ